MSLTERSEILAEHPLIVPKALLQEFPLSILAMNTVQHARTQISNIIAGKDRRLLAIIGPCSIHDPIAALEYAGLLKEAATRFADDLFIVMRVYFEKPRTTIGWKGLISDPLLDGSFDINLGLKIARKLLIDLTKLGIPMGTEFLDTHIAPYLEDHIAWGCIGARTTESQIHRELASGLAMPVGFKNSTDGNIKIAVDAVSAAQHPHYFLSINNQGLPSIIHTQGNEFTHIILRGSNVSQNYTTPHINKAIHLLQTAQLNPKVMIDCSHGNSMKNYQRQTLVINSVVKQLKNHSRKILGVMLESNLVADKQTLQPNQILIYGQSITDACLSWKETLPLLEKLAKVSLQERTRSKLT